MSKRAWLLRAAAIAVVIPGVIWMVRGIDLAALGEVLARARLWPIVLAAVLNFGIIACKAVAWRILLGRAYPIPLARLMRYTLSAYAASVILPLRAGELIRVWWLRDRDHVPAAYGAAVAVAEKLVDVIAMLLLVAPLPWLVRDLPASIQWWIAGLAALVLAAMLVLRSAARRAPETGRLGRFVAGFRVFEQPRALAAVLAVILVSWLIDLAMIDLVMLALGMDVSLAAGILVLFAVNLTIALPSTPAHVGAFELGALVGLRLVGVADADGLAFALIYHILQVVPVVAIGLAFGGRELLRTSTFDAKLSRPAGN